eukprot:4112524-Pleurochrysis_carterae.AAC.1
MPNLGKQKRRSYEPTRAIVSFVSVYNSARSLPLSGDFCTWPNGWADGVGGTICREIPASRAYQLTSGERDCWEPCSRGEPATIAAAGLSRKRSGASVRMHSEAAIDGDGDEQRRVDSKTVLPFGVS